MEARVIHNERKRPTISVRNRRDTRSKPYDEKIAALEARGRAKRGRVRAT